MTSEDAQREQLLAGLRNLCRQALGTTESDRWNDRSAESILESEETFRSLVELSPIGIGVLSPEGNILLANGVLADLLGEDGPEALIGRSILYYLDPAGRAGFMERVSLSRLQHEASFVEERFVRPNGQMMDMEVSAGPAIYQNETAIQIVTRNVSERRMLEAAVKQSYEALQAVFDGMSSSILVLGPAGTITLANSAAEACLEVDSNLVGRNLVELFPEAKELLENATPQERNQLLLTLANGRTKVIGYSSVPVVGTGLRAVIFRDVTPIIADEDQRRHEQELELVVEMSALLTAGETARPATGDEYVSEAMRATLLKARQAASSDSIVLLLGESGSGKDFLARFIHNRSSRSQGPFFDINCAAVAPEIAESELFGHEAGAFTGAKKRKRGLLELAEGGTLLLNEIGELSLHLQAKLLTFLDTRAFSRVGGEKQISVNARLIFATNRNLRDEVEEGRFRRDLFYRVNVMTLTVPPLRERLEDIPILLKHIISQLAGDMNLPRVPVIESDAMDALIRYPWPGNVRELRNVLERALIVSPEYRVTAQAIGLRAPTEEWNFSATFPKNRTLNELLRDLKRSAVMEALRRSGGRRQTAADLLGISRNSLLHYIKSLGIQD